LQRNCHEFISYENLLKTGGDSARTPRTQRTAARSAEARSLSTAMPNIQRALQILAEREVAPQLGLLKSTLLQLDATFSERDFGAGSFLEFIQKLRKAGLVEMRRTDRGYLVEALEGEGARETPPEPAAETAAVEPEPVAAEAPASEAPAAASAPPAPVATAPVPAPASPEDSLAALRQALPSHFDKVPNRPLYLRQIRQLLRAAGSSADERSGFRGLLDLLHQAQREGWLRLHRDRKGVWRVFPAVGPAPAVTPATPAEVEGEVAVAVAAPPELEPELLIPVEADVSWEVEALPEEIAEPAEPPPPAVIEEVVPAEPPPQPKPQPKPRKPRAPKAGTKSGTKKTSSRRKSKEPVGS